jgi:hypothetical protein
MVEYVLLLLLVVGAVTAMTVYIMRSSNARLKQSQQELNFYNNWEK